MAVPVAAGEPGASVQSGAERAPRYYPAFLDLRGRRVVVVGGGPVAAAKVTELLPTGAEVVVVAPEVEPAIRESAGAGELVWQARSYEPGDLAGAFLLLAADSPGVNARAAGEAKRRGVLVNVADDPAHCDLITPAVVRRGELTVAISTGGSSPAFARYVRELLETAIGEEYGVVLDLVAGVRRWLRARGKRAAPEHWQAAIAQALAEYRAGSSRTRVHSRLLTTLGAVRREATRDTTTPDPTLSSIGQLRSGSTRSARSRSVDSLSMPS